MIKGINGDSNRLSIGSVVSGSQADAEIKGESPNQILNLVLPKGEKGDKGDKGEQRRDRTTRYRCRGLR